MCSITIPTPSQDLLPFISCTNWRAALIWTKCSRHRWRQRASSKEARTIITGFIVTKTESKFMCQALFKAMLPYKMAPETNLNEIIGLVKLSGPEIKMTNKNCNFISWKWVAWFFFKFPHACQWSRHQNPNHEWHQTYMATDLYLFFPRVLRWQVKRNCFVQMNDLTKSSECLKSISILYSVLMLCWASCHHHQSFSFWTRSPSLPSRVLI